MPEYVFAQHDQFLDRGAELERLRRWWEDPRDPFPLLLHGRRRTGKSWLLREFAHGRDAQIFTCDTRAEGDQLACFARSLEPTLGFRPDIGDPRSLFHLLLGQGSPARRLVVIDELPLLLQASRGADSSLAAELEERASTSAVRLAICGSQVAVMEALLAERAPLHGRATVMPLAPLRFREARRFLPELGPEDLVTRHAIAGGMPLYLRRIGRPEDLRTVLCEEVLSPLAPLFDEVRSVLTMELTSVATHFSLLAALARAPSLEWTDLVAHSRVEESSASRYVRILEDLRIVEAANPALAPPGSRRRRYRIADRFIQFWFRFVFPYQAELGAGLRPEDHFDRNVAPFLAQHVADAFEQICRDWVRESFRETVDGVAPWWGLARHDLRRQGLRSSEEIDVVGTRGPAVTVVGECRWQSRPMGGGVLADLVRFKLPALGQAGAHLQGARIVLFSKSGFDPELASEAAHRGDVELVDLRRLLDPPAA